MGVTIAVLLSAGCDGAPADQHEDEITAATQSLLAPITRPPITGSPQPNPVRPGTVFNRLLGRVLCTSTQGGTTRSWPLQDVPIEVEGQRAITKADGRFQLQPLSAARASFKIVFDGQITSDGTVSNLRVVDEIGNARNETRQLDIPHPDNTLAPSLDLPTIALVSTDCELYRIGRLALIDYHQARGASPPGGGLRIKRWSAADLAPHTFYDNVSIQENWLYAEPNPSRREEILFHEFGHAIRHVADGPEHHWNWDNFRWLYAREHSGDEIFNTQYAFNEGWANYWSFRATTYSSSSGPTNGLRSPHAVGFLHWNEILIGNRLLALSRLPGSSDSVMLQVLESLPGSIHTLHEFESHLNARLALPPPPAPPACPPGFSDDGATCRQGGEVVAKPSFGRRVGTLPTACGAGNQYDAGLCYPLCAEGYHNIGPVCWENCLPGFTDIGLTCANGSDWRHQNSYVRGFGWVPSACEGSKEYQNGLCYDPCGAGFTGEGPVCWGSCPAGYTIDDGALCRQPLNILTKS